MGNKAASFEEVLKLAGEKGPLPVVVAQGNDEAALSALLLAEEEGIALPIIVGDPGLIFPVIEKIGKKFKKAEIVDSENEKSSVDKAVELIRKGEAKILLKGKVQTGTLMKGVLDKDGKRIDKILIIPLKIPTYKPKKKSAG